MSRFCALLCLMHLIPSMVIEAQESNYETSAHHFESSVVGDEFVLHVNLPVSYSHSENSYPLLIVLDGDKSTGMARDIVDWLSWSREIPELVVAGISYDGSVQEWWQKRSRDFTPTKDGGKIWGDWPLAGGANDFQTFIREELIPLLESKYRVSDERILAGMSFGGLFCTYSLFTQPDLFQRYIIVSPALAWDKRIMWEYEQQYAANHHQLQAVVFTAVGGLDKPNILEPWKSFNDLIDSRQCSGLSWKSHRFKGETHISSWPVALSRGLKGVFENNAN